MSLDDDIDKIIRITDKIQLKSTYAEKNRFGLLMIHSLKGIFVGISVIMFGGPSTFNMDSVEVTAFVGLFSVGGGVVLFISLISGRDPMLELFGMSVLATWDLWMCAVFLYVFIQEDTSSLTDGIVLYPVFVYGGTFSLMCIHLYTFYRYQRAHLE